MSKQLILVRHAKSSWDAHVSTDIERPLNDRGKRDAPLMAQFLAEKSVRPEWIYTSPAVRAITTAKAFVSTWGFPIENLVEDIHIYQADVNHLQAILREFHDDWSSVMLVGHNPTITDCANALCNDELDNIPTCGVYAIELEISSWRTLRNGVGKKLFFQRPKEL